MLIDDSVINKLEREIYNEAMNMITENTGVSFERMVELAVADSEGRIIIKEVNSL